MTRLSLASDSLRLCLLRLPRLFSLLWLSQDGGEDGGASPLPPGHGAAVAAQLDPWQPRCGVQGPQAGTEGPPRVRVRWTRKLLGQRKLRMAYQR